MICSVVHENVMILLQDRQQRYVFVLQHAAAELGKNPVCKHQIQPEYGDEQAIAGRDG